MNIDYTENDWNILGPGHHMPHQFHGASGQIHGPAPGGAQHFAIGTPGGQPPPPPAPGGAAAASGGGVVYQPQMGHTPTAATVMGGDTAAAAFLAQRMQHRIRQGLGPYAQGPGIGHHFGAQAQNAGETHNLAQPVQGFAPSAAAQGFSGTAVPATTLPIMTVAQRTAAREAEERRLAQVAESNDRLRLALSRGMGNAASSSSGAPAQPPPPKAKAAAAAAAGTAATAALVHGTGALVHGAGTPRRAEQATVQGKAAAKAKALADARRAHFKAESQGRRDAAQEEARLRAAAAVAAATTLPAGGGDTGRSIAGGGDTGRSVAASRGSGRSVHFTPTNGAKIPGGGSADRSRSDRGARSVSRAPSGSTGHGSGNTDITGDIVSSRGSSSRR